MERNIIDMGTRKVQQNNGAHFLNIPNPAVRVLGIHRGDTMMWSLVDGVLQIQQIEEDIDHATTQ